MSEPSPAQSESPSTPKKGVSPARNIIGLIVLIAVATVGWFEYSAKSGYNAAVNALDARSQDENKGLATVQEADGLLNKLPDGPGTDVTEGSVTFTKKTYTWRTWRGLLKSYVLTAFFTKEKDPHLHHFATEGAKPES
jgi:hypothetical protein